MEYWKQELYHHGILGMKWGKRNGPPYPLSRDSSGHTAEERKVGWQKSKLGKRNTSLYDRNEAEAARRRYWEKKGRSAPPNKQNVKNIKTDKENTPKQNKSNQRAGATGEKSGRKLVSETTTAGRIAAVAILSSSFGLMAAQHAMLNGYDTEDVVGTFLATMGISAAVLGGYIAAQELSYKKDKDKNIKNNTKFDEIVKIKGPHSEKSDQKAINPKFNDDFKYQMNCTMCTTAYEMRRRGYDVEANATKKGRMTRDAAAWFNVSDNDIYDFKDYKDFKSKINTMPDGARGNVCAQVGPFLSLHSMVWEKKGNSVIIRDCQTNETYNSLDSSIINQEGNIFEFFRTDNATINEELIMDAIRKAGS